MEGVFCKFTNLCKLTNFAPSLTFGFLPLKIMQNENLSTEQTYNTLLTLWFSLFMSQFMFLIVIYFIKPEVFNFDLSKPFLGENAVIVILFGFLAVSTLIMSLFLSRRFINEAIKHQKVGLVQNALIVGCALCESISLFGFLLAFMFGYQYFFIWFAIGIIGMIFHFPKRENLHLATYQKSQKF